MKKIVVLILYRYYAISILCGFLPLAIFALNLDEQTYSAVYAYIRNIMYCENNVVNQYTSFSEKKYMASNAIAICTTLLSSSLLVSYQLSHLPYVRQVAHPESFKMSKLQALIGVILIILVAVSTALLFIPDIYFRTSFGFCINITENTHNRSVRWWFLRSAFAGLSFTLCFSIYPIMFITAATSLISTKGRENV